MSSYYTILGLSIVSAVVILAIATWAHGSSSKVIYSSLLGSISNGAAAWNTADFEADSTGIAYLTTFAREGATKSRSAITDAYIWATALLILGVVCAWTFGKN